jgi:hypothetical protein
MVSVFRGLAIFAAQEAVNKARGIRASLRAVGASMRFRGVIGDNRMASLSRPFSCAFAGLPGALLGLAVFALAGCGAGNDAGSLLIDPGRYSAYHCNELAAQWKILVAREKELRGLMDKASEGGGGAVIGSLAYRTDYESTLSDERLLKQTAAEKNCGSTTEFQSDQGIR